MGELLAFILYFIVIIGIGIYFFLKTKGGMGQYFLGGRQLNSWVIALSAQASDMSAWLLMGLPGSLFAFGLGKVWIAIGLAIGTYLNWLFTAERLRRFTEAAGDSITIPEYLQNRFQASSPALRIVCAIVFFACFAIYSAASFKAGGLVFSTVLGMPYETTVIIFSIIVVLYTFLGGFLAVCWTDFVQGMLMLAAILFAPIAAFFVMGGIDPGFYAGVDANFLNLFPTGTFDYASFASIASGLGWGLGYFGMPHILVRFMAIKEPSMIKRSRRIAVIWVLLALVGAVAVGILGRAFVPEIANSEYVFIEMVRNIFPPFIAGILLSAIIAASMSTADSQLLVAASALTSDVYQPMIRKNASDKELLLVSRLVVIAIAIVAFIMAVNPNSGSIMGLVENAWAGFGAAFGPVILLSLYWKRLTYRGAVTGIIFGGITVFLWIALGLSAATQLYEILPGVVMGSIGAVVGSLVDKAPSAEVLALFEKAMKTKKDEK